ncbi:hypothetical protein [uncultured Agrobacterium sp.]|uniref:hypothetical protein n=1 Tax=uncultured Agrobacterium sp. TaxID=157277 RepID=UPI00258FF3A6|nr:hypothetical protein [uncultured Agrobacterium sp.]
MWLNWQGDGGQPSSHPDGKGWTLIKSDRFSGKVFTLVIRVLPAVARGLLFCLKSRTGR